MAQNWGIYTCLPKHVWSYACSSVYLSGRNTTLVICHHDGEQIESEYQVEGWAKVITPKTT